MRRLWSHATLGWVFLFVGSCVAHAFARAEQTKRHEEVMAILIDLHDRPHGERSADMARLLRQLRP